MTAPFATTPFAAASHAAFLSKPLAFFTTPIAVGRKITCGFSYLQRIGKNAATDVWFPADLQHDVAERIAHGDTTILDEFRVEWAAVRQFELLQEGNNFCIDDLEITDPNKAFRNVMGMRAGGYRVTIITMGRYVTPYDQDDLHILDRRLQEEITRFVHMIYLEEHSGVSSAAYTTALQTGQWTYQAALPHVAEAIHAAALFRRGNGQRQQQLSHHFMRIMDLLPQTHIVHDVAVGLTLPEKTAEKNWIYIAQGERQFLEFQKALNTVFGGFDHINLGALHGRVNAPSEILSSMRHMRGYGDHLRH